MYFVRSKDVIYPVQYLSTVLLLYPVVFSSSLGHDSCHPQSLLFEKKVDLALSPRTDAAEKRTA